MQDARVKAFQFLQEHTCMAVATIDANGDPHVSTVYYVADDDFICYFLTRESTQKHKNISANSHVAAVVTNEKDEITLQLTGTAQIVTSEKLREKILHRLTQKTHEKEYGPSPVVKMHHSGEYCLYQIKPQHARFADFRQVYKNSGEDYIETIF